ncbi:hypothetical protein ALC56_02039, partial [Trachymyrmex septentrionalis]
EERVSTRVVRGRTRLYYTKGTDGETRRPRSLPLMMLYSRLPRSLSYLLAASRCLLDILAHRTRISSEDSRLCPPLRSGEDLRRWRSGVPGRRKESVRSLNGQLSLTPFVPRFSLRCACSYFLFATFELILAYINCMNVFNHLMQPTTIRCKFRTIVEQDVRSSSGKFNPCLTNDTKTVDVVVGNMVKKLYVNTRRIWIHRAISRLKARANKSSVLPSTGHKVVGFLVMRPCDFAWGSWKKPEALIKRGTGRSLAHFSIWRINARWLGDNSKVYRPRISSFQATPIFTTKLLGYSTLARFMGLT